MRSGLEKTDESSAQRGEGGTQAEKSRGGAREKQRHTYTVGGHKQARCGPGSTGKRAAGKLPQASCCCGLRGSMPGLAKRPSLAWQRSAATHDRAARMSSAPLTVKAPPSSRLSTLTAPSSTSMAYLRAAWGGRVWVMDMGQRGCMRRSGCGPSGVEVLRTQAQWQPHGRLRALQPHALVVLSPCALQCPPSEERLTAGCARPAPCR